MQKFNVDYTACGMALYLSEIEAAGKDSARATDADWLVIGNDKMARAEDLRNEGYKVIHLFDGDDIDKYLSALGIKGQTGSSEYKLQK